MEKLLDEELEEVNGGFNSAVFSINISPDDTLMKIVKRYQVNLKVLCKLNNLRETDSLEGRHKLLIPFENKWF